MKEIGFTFPFSGLSISEGDIKIVEFFSWKKSQEMDRFFCIQFIWIIAKPSSAAVAAIQK